MCKVILNDGLLELGTSSNGGVVSIGTFTFVPSDLVCLLINQILYVCPALGEHIAGLDFEDP
jgi:hypothetical protein